MQQNIRTEQKISTATLMTVHRGGLTDNYATGSVSDLGIELGIETDSDRASQTVRVLEKG